MIIPASVAPWAWAVAAVVIALLELPVPGTYLIWIACAAAITAVASFLVDWSLSAQLTIFIVSSIGTCIAGYFVYRRLGARGNGGEAINRRDLDLVGASGVVAETFVSGQGRIRLGDSVWLAEADEDLPSGTAVIVSGVRGTTLVVRRRAQGGAAATSGGG